MNENFFKSEKISGLSADELAGKNTVVSSPAGSGKTTLLVEIFIELLKRGHSFEDIVAITYTNKAAGEMKQRIINSLLSGENDRLKKPLSNYLNSPRELRVSTIHSFLGSLIGIIEPSYSIEGDPLDSRSSQRYFEHFLYKFVNNHQSEKEYQNILKKVPYSKIKRIIAQLQNKAPISAIWAEEILSAGDKELEERLGGKSITDYYRTLAAIYFGVFEIFMEWKRRHSYFEYADIEYYGYRLIKKMDFAEDFSDWRDILLVFNERFKAMLIDEFQDTSELQWRIVDSLVEDWLSGEGLREVSDAAVYLIGDPKQSIYAFRGADVSVMQKIRQKFEQLEKMSPKNFKTKQLTVNRRSTGTIVNFVNELFSLLMQSKQSPDSSELWKTVYESFEHSREGEYSEALAVNIESTNKIKTLKATRLEATWVANKIAELVSGEELVEGENNKLRKVKFKDIAVLLKNKTHAGKYEKMLSEAEIPFVSIDSGYTSIKAFEFLKSFFLAEDPGREEAKIVKLLSLIGQNDNHYTGINHLKKLAPPYNGLFDAFQKYRSEFKRGAFAGFKGVEKILKQIAFKTFNNRAEIELSFKLFNELFLIIDDLSPASTYRAALLLESSITDLLPELSIKSNAVTIMSIHKAKGLEFPVVFSCALWGTGRSGSVKLIPSEKDEHICEISLGKLKEETTALSNKTLKQINDYEEKIKKINREFKKEEELRLFYVALTRARDRLYVLCPDISRSNRGYKELRRVIVDGLPAENLLSVFEDEIKQLQPPKLSKQFKKKTGLRAFERTVRDGKKLSEIVENSEDFSFKKLVSRQKSPAADIGPLEKKSPPVLIGTLVHQVLYEIGEGYLNKEKVMERIDELAGSMNIKKSEVVSSSKKLLKEFLESEYFSLARGDFSISEYPFVEVNENGYREGRIDLIFYGDDSVKVLDYKSDRDVGESTGEYRKQLNEYIHAVSNLNPESKVSAGILFLRNLKYVDYEDL